MPRLSLRLLPLLLLPILLYIYNYQPQYFDQPRLKLSETGFRLPFGGKSNQHHRPSGAGRRRRQEITLGSFNVRFDGQSKWPSSMISKLSSTPPNQLDSNQYPPSQDWSEQAWNLRRHLIADTALFNSWDIFAFQEVLHGQLLDLTSLLGPEYSHIGVGRNDGKQKGEAVPVFFKSSKFKLVSDREGGVGKDGVEHFWLSETPNRVGSVGWDSDQTRMCSHLALKTLDDDEDQQIIHVFSTHYDHKGVIAREKSSELIVKKAQEVAEKGKKLVQDGKAKVEPLIILIGDLNSPRNEMGWQNLVAGKYGVPSRDQGPSFSFLDAALSLPSRFTSPYLSPKGSLKFQSSSSMGYVDDSRLDEKAIEEPLQETRKGRGKGKAKVEVKEGEEVEVETGGLLSNPVGPRTTFTGFSPSNRTPEEDRIDFILLGSNSAVLDETNKHTIYPRPSEASSNNVGKWRIRTFGVIPNWSEGDAGFLMSDHRAVQTRLQRD